MDSYIYQFLDANNSPIYVGRTKDIESRIRGQHFSGAGHLPRECYEETEMVLYSKCLHHDDAAIKERYLINMLSPKYNTLMNHGVAFNYTIDDFDWVYMPFEKQLDGNPQARPTYKSFKRDTLSPALAEINSEKTNLTIRLEERRRGRAVHQLRFHISEKSAVMDCGQS